MEPHFVLFSCFTGLASVTVLSLPNSQSSFHLCFVSSEHESGINAMISDSHSSEQPEDEVSDSNVSAEEQEGLSGRGRRQPQQSQQGEGVGVEEGVVLPLHLQVKAMRILIH